MQTLRNMMRGGAWVAVLLACVLIAGQLFAMQAVFDAGIQQLLLPAETENQQNWLRLTASHMADAFARSEAMLQDQYTRSLTSLVQWLQHSADGIDPTWPPSVSWMHFSASGGMLACSALSPEMQRLSFDEALALVQVAPFPFFDQATTPTGDKWLLFVQPQTIAADKQQAALDLLGTWPAQDMTVAVWLQRATPEAGQNSIVFQREISAATPVVYGYQVPLADASPLRNALSAEELLPLNERTELFYGNIAADDDAPIQPCAVLALPGTDLALCVSARALSPDILLHPDISRFRALCTRVFYITLIVCLATAIGTVLFLWQLYRKGMRKLTREQQQLAAREGAVEQERRQIDAVYADLRRLGALTPHAGMHNPSSVVHWLDGNFDAFARLTSDEILGGGRSTAIALLALDDVDTLYAEADGHAAVDALLDQLAPILEQRIRKNDLVSRWHDASFLVVLSSISLKDALMRTEDLRAAVAGRSFTAPDGTHTISLTCGLSLMLTGDRSWRQALERASRAQQRGRDSNKNRIYHDIM